MKMAGAELMEEIRSGQVRALMGGASRHGWTTLRCELRRQSRARPGNVHVALSECFGLGLKG